jgi:predicted AAA+ superfamily ATPase
MPRSFLATSDEASVVWRNAYLASVLERDLPAHGIRTPATTLRRMWTMVAHYHTSSLNLAALSRSLDVAPQTVRGFLDVLTDAMIIRQLQPWHANIGKRQRKTPKLLVRDSGLYHGTLGITNDVQLSTHPNKGASWEAFAVEQVLTMMQPTEAYTWVTHQGAEMDLLMVHNGKRIGVEVTFTSQPRRTASMQQAIVDLELDSVLVVYPGSREFAIAENIAAVPLHQIRTLDTW